ncbi:MAG TPA: M20 family metallopeptidase [Firmicutes bacterium]|nr:M20 family metallopeptidase [Bacillota bacterium]
MVSEEKLLSAVEAESVAKLLQRVIQIESTNPPGNEIDLAEWLAAFFGDHMEVTVLPYEGKHANLVARIKGVGGRPALIFSAHLDTVPAGEVPWMFPPFSGTLHEGKVYGRGAADMKGGLAAMAQAAVILAESGAQLKGDLIIAFTYDETYGLKGAKLLVEGGYLDGAGAVLVSEPSTLDVFTAEKGALWLQARVEGKTAHTSMPHLGVNAVSEMVRFLSRIEQELDFGEAFHPLLGRPTVNLSTIRGGVTINVVPDVCEAQIDIRLLPGQDHREVVQRVRQLGGAKVKVEVLDWKEPVETDPRSEIVDISLKAVSEVTGIPRQPKGVSYYTDGTIIANRLRIPMVIIGPADTGMTHQPNEHVEVERLVQAVKSYLLIAARYLG